MDSMLLKFFHSIAVGICIAIPIGPVSVLCMRYSLKQGPLAGVMVALGAASGDIIYASIAVFSIDIINSYLISVGNILKVPGGLFLLVLSARAFYNDRIERFSLNTMKHDNDDSNKYIYLVSFFTTLLSPITILLFIGTFSTIDLKLNGFSDHCAVPIGVFIGSALWMSSLAMLLRYIKDLLTDSVVYYTNLFFNIAISSFGIYAIVTGLYQLF